MYKLFTRVTAAILEHSQASIAVLMTDEVLVLPKGYYLEAARNMSDQSLPVYCWVYFGLIEEEGDTGGFTFGLKEFGLPEMEISRSENSIQEVHGVLYDAVQYVLQYQIRIKDGQQVPVDGLNVKAGYADPVYLQEGPVVKLAY
ncbi:MAG: DUF4261 domain-containing protein [Lewinellaceae bacterium]|nr:DUF4261 domain-containing protein [Lewinellaceae bacterium]